MFLLMGLLVLISIATLVAAIAMGSAVLFLAAAIVSAVVVLALWRRVESRRSSTFVLDPPPRSVPDWNRPLREPFRIERDRTALPVVAIDDYDDLVAAEIILQLEELSSEQLLRVIEHESAGRGREGIIRRAQRLIDLTEQGPEARAAELTRERDRGLEHGRRGPGLSL